MGLPEFILLFLIAVELIKHAAKDGEEKKEEYNFALSILSAFILLLLLYWGGFFK